MADPVLWAHIHPDDPGAPAGAGAVASDPVPFAAGDDPHERHPGMAWAQVPAGTAVTSGMRWTGTAFGPAPVATPKPPNVISDRQFAQQAAIQGLISQAEALAWVASGAIPPELEALIDKLPADQQFGAKMMLAGATTYLLNNPLTVALTTAFGWKDADRDAFWRAASAL